MSFIDDGIVKRKGIVDRASLIVEHAPKIYEDLWKRMDRYIIEAKQKGFTLYTNGSLHDRLVQIQTQSNEQSVSHREGFRVTLNDSKERISARGERGVSFDFILDVCSDGVVCLKFNDQQISTEDAAVAVLNQFLFPDLKA